MRLLVPLLFGTFAIATAFTAADATADAVGAGDSRLWLLAGYWVLRTIVVVAFTVFVVQREAPHRPSREPVAFTACAVAIVSLVALDEPAADASRTGLLVGDVVALVSCTWLVIAVLALGKCFGVLPEARGLVVRGPYRHVRHPVYLGELGAFAGLVIAAPTTWNLAMLLAHFGAQWVRMGLEERALTRAFPQYATYARRTGRLLPRLRAEVTA